ncbi:hypothetical protein KP509_1Z102600 [Ceratopteris richardii]|nr:hypothetical protein KP509_1Z102600 [Ceratopteris richardii]
MNGVPSSSRVSIPGLLRSQQVCVSSNMKSDKFHEPESVQNKRPKVDQDNCALGVPPNFGHVPPNFGHVPPNFGHSSMTITVHWFHPHKVFLDESWLWANGDGSIEVAIQQQRERVHFEAFYPESNLIPDSPMECQGLNKTENDTSIPEVPLDPLEESMANECNTHNYNIGNCEEGNTFDLMSEKGTTSIPHNYTVSKNSPKELQENVISAADAHNFMMAATACLAVKALGASKLIDEALLFELLRNPSLIDSLACSDKLSKGKSLCQGEVDASLTMPSYQGSNANSLSSNMIGYGTNSLYMIDPQRKQRNINGKSYLHKSMNASVPGKINQYNPVHLFKASHEISKMDIFNQEKISKASDTCTIRAVHDEHKMGSQKDFYNDPFVQYGNLHTRMTANLYSPTCLPSTFNMNMYSQQQVWAMQVGRRTNCHDKTAQNVNTKVENRKRKLCMYFNASKGCRYGQSCMYVHHLIEMPMQVCKLNDD